MNFLGLLLLLNIIVFLNFCKKNNNNVICVDIEKLLKSLKKTQRSNEGSAAAKVNWFFDSKEVKDFFKGVDDTVNKANKANNDFWNQVQTGIDNHNKKVEKVVNDITKDIFTAIDKAIAGVSFFFSFVKKMLT